MGPCKLTQNFALLLQANFGKIKPSSTLQFHPCFGEFECARLDVPLDWTASSTAQSKERAAVAITRLPAKVPVISNHYGGAVLLNPGGPGGSGVSLVLSIGSDAQKVIDTGKSKVLGHNETEGLHYDIIGFDPRGINNTTPSASCFPDDASRQFWEVQNQAQGMLYRNESFPAVWGRTQAMAEGCSARLKREGVGKYMNTPVVVNDMVAIIEALGEWREREANLLVKSTSYKTQEEAAILERTKWKQGEEKLLYWGFSYGTLLGATFASMYPEKVNRLVLDGVVDAEDYYAGTWLSNLVDTDSIVGKFFTQCYEAGPERCALHSPDGIEGIRKIYHSVLEDLFLHPIPVAGNDRYGPDLITRTDAMMYIKDFLYKPVTYAVPLARIMFSLSQRNGSELSTLKQKSRHVYCRSPLCERKPYSQPCYDASSSAFRSEVSAAVLCTDASATLLNWTAEDHFNKWHALRSQSLAFGDYWTEVTMFCASWNVRPAWNFSNPDISAAKTAHPILWASNTRDPVTPLKNAMTMKGKFGGSGLLVQEADGHCTLSAPSSCVARHIRNYFQDGTLPEEGLVCESDKGPFDGDELLLALSEEERGLYDVIVRISEGLGSERGAPLL
ncbi:hypothetical protein EG327_008548 [Venturia inaequalis]|uniref:Peptidase S33 tripeptidyl aminopeptidase-like C-terminal domain-containing protein n=1 Tax=Venturia inaequalis TaxID=5025 RepID=A0A8H3YVF8_VENIN|nr:hypothetical protein EG327_008548 [Venturia inaequalis]